LRAEVREDVRANGVMKYGVDLGDDVHDFVVESAPEPLAKMTAGVEFRLESDGDGPLRRDLEPSATITRPVR